MQERVAIKGVRIPFTESLRFPEEGSSAQGKSDPKPRPKGVGDGKQGRKFLYHQASVQDAMGGRRSERSASHWLYWSKSVGGPRRQIRVDITPRDDRGTRLRASQLTLIMLPRKASKRVCSVSVPQTDTGRQVENTKVLE